MFAVARRDDKGALLPEKRLRKTPGSLMPQESQRQHYQNAPPSFQQIYHQLIL